MMPFIQKSEIAILIDESNLGCEEEKVRVLQDQVELEIRISEDPDLFVSTQSLRDKFASSDESRCPIKTIEVLQQTLEPLKNTKLISWNEQTGLLVSNLRTLKVQNLILVVRASNSEKK